MKEKIIEEKSCGTIIIQNNEVLVIQQKNGDYGFPKGHMEANETEIDTALRETKEETNLDVEIMEHFRFTTKYINPNFNTLKECVFFIAKPLTTEVEKQISEIAEIEWVSLFEVENRLTHSDLKQMWRLVIEEINNNSF